MREAKKTATPSKRRLEKGERVAIYLPPVLAHRLRIRCVREKRSMSDAVTQAVRSFLRTPEILPGKLCPEKCEHLWVQHDGESAPHECSFYDGVSSVSVRLRKNLSGRALRCAACLRDKGKHITQSTDP